LATSSCEFHATFITAPELKWRSYPFDLPPDLPIERDSDGAAPAGRSSLAAHTNKHGQLLLGHVSILTSIALAHTVDPHSGQRRRYIITSDRDEHIRVSRYPQAHIIEQFCLGSKSFVTALHICSAQSGGELRALVSGGGENQIRFWDWLSGHCLGSAEIGNVVTPFIKIRRKVRASEGDDQEGEAAPAAEALEGNALDETEAQIAVQQIESFVLDGELCIIFSVVG
jgi:tRNA (guanine-N(7)-)-methyltransferase subunit TRM82